MEKPAGQLKLWIASGVNAAKCANFNHMKCHQVTFILSPSSLVQKLYTNNTNNMTP